MIPLQVCCPACGKTIHYTRKFVREINDAIKAEGERTAKLEAEVKRLRKRIRKLKQNAS